MGLFRLWWIPEGARAGEGTYVRYDHEALLGVVALEAYRAGSLVIGEDLGTVEPGVREELADRGILGTSVLRFEYLGGSEQRSGPLPPERWRADCLATLTTHDLPSTAAWLEGEHIRLHDRLGLLTQPEAEARAAAEAERDGWLAELRRTGALGPDGEAGRDTCPEEKRTAFRAAKPWPCTAFSPGHPRSSWASGCPTPSGTAARRTCPARPTSTPTGACPWPDRKDFHSLGGPVRA